PLCYKGSRLVHFPCPNELIQSAARQYRSHHTEQRRARWRLANNPRAPRWNKDNPKTARYMKGPRPLRDRLAHLQFAVGIFSIRLIAGVSAAPLRDSSYWQFSPLKNGDPDSKKTVQHRKGVGGCSYLC